MIARILCLPFLCWCLVSSARDAGGSHLEKRIVPVTPPKDYPGMYTYKAQLMKAEKAYRKQVSEARTTYIQDLKDYRARTKLTQPALQRLNEEITRLEHLEDPQVSPEPSK